MADSRQKTHKQIWTDRELLRELRAYHRIPATITDKDMLHLLMSQSLDGAIKGWVDRLLSSGHINATDIAEMTRSVTPGGTLALDCPAGRFVIGSVGSSADRHAINAVASGS